MARRPILKAFSALDDAQSCASSPFPFASCPTLLLVDLDLRVHFPPSPTLTSTHLTHSPTAYDRKPIVVVPNTCALPERGARTVRTASCDGRRPQRRRAPDGNPSAPNGNGDGGGDGNNPSYRSPSSSSSSYDAPPHTIGSGFEAQGHSVLFSNMPGGGFAAPTAYYPGTPQPDLDELDDAGPLSMCAIPGRKQPHGVAPWFPNNAYYGNAYNNSASDHVPAERPQPRSRPPIRPGTPYRPGGGASRASPGTRSSFGAPQLEGCLGGF